MFTLSVSTCNAKILEIERQYGVYPQEEGFSLATESGIELFSEIASGSRYSGTVLYRFCISERLYRITLTSAQDYWRENSYGRVYVRYTAVEREPVSRFRFDSLIGLPTEIIISTEYAISAESDWFYHMSTIPPSWTSSDCSEWSSSSIGSFPSSSNQIQLYKQHFQIVNPSDVVALSTSTSQSGVSYFSEWSRS